MTLSSKVQPVNFLLLLNPQAAYFKELRLRYIQNFGRMMKKYAEEPIIGAIKFKMEESIYREDLLLGEKNALSGGP